MRVRVCACVAVPGQIFRGDLALVRIWRRALSAGMIRATRGRAAMKDVPQVEACWTFFEGRGGSVHDSSSNKVLCKLQAASAAWSTCWDARESEVRGCGGLGVSCL